MKDIVLTTINAKWIHPSLALRLLKINLGTLEDRCEIIEFALRQSLAEILESLLAALVKENGCARILGISVSIWNHTATLELLGELDKTWKAAEHRPVVVLGGPEVSSLPPDAEIFRYADYVIRGEGEIAFRTLCEDILTGKMPVDINAKNVDVGKIKTAYHLYTNEDIARKLIYVEASRGCPFNCEFCLSADNTHIVREFPLEPFLAEMDTLVRRGVKTFKFLDRSFNVNIERARRICEFFLEKIEERKADPDSEKPLVVHFEMVPSLFPDKLRQVLSRFPPGTLRLEIGVQTLNAEAAARVGRPSRPEKELEAIRFLREKTHAIIHADLIAGLPGEDIASFGRGFDRLWLALRAGNEELEKCVPSEIQLGILKLLPGALISRHNESFGMRYNPKPPYEVEETSAMNALDIQRIKNFARFWELILNRYGFSLNFNTSSVFNSFMALSDLLFARFGRNWGIDKKELLKAAEDFY